MDTSPVAAFKLTSNWASCGSISIQLTGTVDFTSAQRKTPPDRSIASSGAAGVELRRTLTWLAKTASNRSSKRDEPRSPGQDSAVVALRSGNSNSGKEKFRSSRSTRSSAGRFKCSAQQKLLLT
ncbi:hypothetical protein D3C76_938680 [compost metagenome]